VVLTVVVGLLLVLTNKHHSVGVRVLLSGLALFWVVYLSTHVLSPAGTFIVPSNRSGAGVQYLSPCCDKSTAASMGLVFLLFFISVAVWGTLTWLALRDGSALCWASGKCRRGASRVGQYTSGWSGDSMGGASSPSSNQ
jgi:hypothetical protein